MTGIITQLVDVHVAGSAACAVAVTWCHPKSGS
jgi:hypothetical protein